MQQWRSRCSSVSCKSVEYAVHARGKRWGLQTMCEGGGLANVTIIEAL